MTKNKKLARFLVLGIAVFLLIEEFTNFALYLNAVIFLKWKNLLVALPWIIIYVSVIIGELGLFATEKIKEDYRPLLLIILIIILRALTQFFILPELYLLFLTALFSSLLIFLTEILREETNFQAQGTIEIILPGILFGAGIHLIFLILNMSTNLCVEPLKIPIILTFLILLGAAGYKLFRPEKIRRKIEERPPEVKKSELKTSYYLLLGTLFFFGLSWVYNPVSLAAYDAAILEWFAYAFLYYALIILGSSLVSYYIIRVLFLNSKNGEPIKRTLMITNLAFIILNILAFFTIDAEFSLFSTILLTILVFISIFTFLLDISYLLHYFSFPSWVKCYLGGILFIMGIVLSYTLDIVLTRTLYLSLLLPIVILTAVIGTSFIASARSGLQKLKIKNLRDPIPLKIYSLIFMSLFALSFLSVYSITYHRTYEDPREKNPTIMVWNIHNGIGSDSEFNLDRIISEIKEYDPDILGLNEVDMGILKTGLVDIASYFAQELDMYYFYGPTFYNHYGNAFFSKYPIQEVKNIDLPVAEGVYSEPRGVIRAKVEINDKIWTIYVNHLATNEEHRKEQVPFVIEFMEEEEVERVVWMGDFNMKPDSKPYKLVNSSSDEFWLRDTHAFLEEEPDLTGGFDPDNNYKPRNRIDYIFCSPDLISTKAKVHWSLASDHCAVITEF